MFFKHALEKIYLSGIAKNWGSAFFLEKNLQISSEMIYFLHCVTL